MNVLIADDHIPDSEIAIEDIAEAIVQKYSRPDSGLEKKMRFMRKVVTDLTNSGIHIDICNRASTVREMLGQKKYDVAVIDLGWYADLEVPRAEREEKMGWELIEQVRTDHEHLPLLLCSERIMTNQKIARGAVDRGVLPVCKRFDETFISILEATLKFVGRPVFDMRPTDLKIYKALSYLTVACLIVALVFLATGLLLALTTNYVTVSKVTAGMGVITTAMSGLFWNYRRKVRESIAP